MNLKAKIMIVAILIISINNYIFWNNLEITQSTTSFTNCDNFYMYLHQDNNSNWLPDYSNVPKTNYIEDIAPTQWYNAIQMLQSSNVQYYLSSWVTMYTKDASGTIMWVDNTLFGRQSWVFPYNQAVRTISSLRYIILELWSTTWANNQNAWFKFFHNFKKATWYEWTSTSNYRYTPIPSLSFFGETDFVRLQDNRKRSWSTQTFHYDTCTNYNIQRCGDKKISTHTWFKINNTFYPVNSWVSTWFTPEVCDSNTETWAACVNGTLWCCNITCSEFGWGFCGDGIVQEELDETCDLWVDLNGSNECSIDCLIPPLDAPVDEAVIE